MKKLVLAGALVVVLSTVSFSQSGLLSGWSSGSYNEKWYGVQKEFNIWGTGSLSIKAYVEGGFYNSSTSYPVASLSGQGLGAQGGIKISLNTTTSWAGAMVKYWFGSGLKKGLFGKIGSVSWTTSFSYASINFGTGNRSGTGLFKAL